MNPIHPAARILAAAVVAANLMSLGTIGPAAAGTSTDNRAPAPRGAIANTAGVSRHIKAVNATKVQRRDKIDQPCTSIHCNGHGHQHHHQH